MILWIILVVVSWGLMDRGISCVEVGVISCLIISLKSLLGIRFSYLHRGRTVAVAHQTRYSRQ